jgi:RNA polymerase sigma-70 factor (ECF subfamily)
MTNLPTMTFTLPELDDLLKTAQSGDAAALDAIFDSFTSYLSMLAAVSVGARLRRKLDPDDIVQETLLEAHRQFPQFRGRSGRELIGWVRRILAGQIALTLRRYLGTKRRDVRMERECPNYCDNSADRFDRALIAAEPNPCFVADQREQEVLLSGALNRLPRDYREVIVLRQVEALTFGETARRMGRSEDAVQKLWIRALTNLRREFQTSAEAA